MSERVSSSEIKAALIWVSGSNLPWKEILVLALTGLLRQQEEASLKGYMSWDERDIPDIEA